MRVTQAGLLTPSQVKYGMAVVFALAALPGLYLAWLGGWPIIVIGLAAILSAIAYTGGPFPLGYYGLGYYIYYNGSTLLDYPAMYAGVLAMSLLGLGMYFTVDWLERKWCKWKFVT